VYDASSDKEYSLFGGHSPPLRWNHRLSQKVLYLATNWQRHIPEVRNLQDNLITAIKEKDVYMSSKITK
jgi:hypothetical protein